MTVCLRYIKYLLHDGLDVLNTREVSVERWKLLSIYLWLNQSMSRVYCKLSVTKTSTLWSGSVLFKDVFRN